MAIITYDGGTEEDHDNEEWRSELTILHFNCKGIINQRFAPSLRYGKDFTEVLFSVVFNSYKTGISTNRWDFFDPSD